MRVKHYPRVSSKSQAEEGDSIEFQEKRLNEDSEKKGDKIIGTYTDGGKSASISEDKMKIWHTPEGFIFIKIDAKKRVGMIDILNSLDDSDWDLLKVTKWDRFSRNMIFSLAMFQYFKEHGKTILAVDDSNDSLVRDFLGLLGQKEIEKLKGRVRDVRQLRFEKGIFPARSPFGYRPLIKDKKIAGFKIYPKEAEIVQDCFKMASEGAKYSDVCKKHKLKPQQYYNIIKNKSYCGYVTFEGQEKKGIHEPIIAEEVWKKLNEASK